MGEVSVNENLNYDDPTAEVVDFVPWADRLGIAVGLLGGWVNVGGFLTYVAPAYYQDIPTLVCKNVKTKWLGDIDEATGDWKSAEIVVSYGKPETQDQVVDFGELGLDISAEALSVPGKAFKWNGGPDNGKALNKEDDITPQVIIPSVAIHLKRKSPFLILSTIVGNIGRINSGFLTVAGYSFASETVLFAGASASRKFTSEGHDLWEYDFQFMAKGTSWNKFFHKSGSYHYLTPLVYGSGNLGVFFS